MRQRPASSFATDCTGLAAVETVLIMPLAILVLVLALEGGNYLYSEHQVVEGVRDASRFAARLPLSTWNCTGATAETDLSSSNGNWQTIANVAVYGNVAGATRARVWTWSAAPADGQVKIRYACVSTSSSNLSGIYGPSGFAPQIAVIGKPHYNSLFLTMTGFSASAWLYARVQAAGSGL